MRAGKQVSGGNFNFFIHIAYYSPLIGTWIFLLSTRWRTYLVDILIGRDINQALLTLGAKYYCIKKIEANREQVFGFISSNFNVKKIVYHHPDGNIV